MTTIKLSMPKLAFVLLIMIGVFFILNGYQASAGPLDKFTPKTLTHGTTVTRGDLDQLYLLVSKAEGTLQESVDIVFRMVANKEQRTKIRVQKEAVKQIKNPQESEAAIKLIYNDEQAMIQQNLESEEGSRKIATLSSQQRVLFANATYNILLAGLMDYEAVRRAQQLSKAIQSNPTYAVSFAGDLDKTTKITTTLPSQADKTTKLGNNLVKLARVNKIQPVIPQSFADKPREVDPEDAKYAQSSREERQEVSLEDNESSATTKEAVPAKSSLDKSKGVDSRDRQPSQSSRIVIATWTFVTIRSNAGNEFPIVTDVRRGDKLLILGEKGQWLNVKLESGTRGWVNKQFVK
jgi:hypothetical protein